MSYYASNYYRDPGPVYGTSDVGEPVPGWGPLPVMAGGPRVGVGQVTAAPEGERVFTFVGDEGGGGGKPSAGIPAWAWVVGAGLIGTGVGLARNKGWLRKVGLSP